jgi:hypothetical protein
MAYKKYIEKNGKIYGPYIYHSKRVNGKVVSEYRGIKKEEKKFRKKLIIGLITILIIFAIFWVFFFRAQFSGRVVLDVENKYVEGEIIESKININLREGELLPSNSKLIIENANKQYEFNLSEIIKEDSLSGTYFIENLEINGEGEGYGKIGKKELTPTIFFKLNITSQEEILSEKPPIETNEEIIIKTNETQTEEKIENENSSEIEPQVETTTEEIISEELPQKTETSIITNMEPEQEPLNIENESQKIQTPITGNIIEGTFSTISSFFRGILTGQIIQEEIQGDISKNNPKEYNLPENAKVEIIPGSVQTEEKKLPENILNLKIENQKLIISTNYSEIKEGFGEEFLGNETILSIDLNELNITLEEGEIIVKIDYNGQEIYSLKDEIYIKKPIEETNITEPIENITEPITNETNITQNITKETIYNLSFKKIDLTENEKEIIKNNINFPLIQTEVKEYKDKYEVYFTIDKYTLEHHYSKELNETELKNQIKRDRTIWLKDLAKKFSEEKTITKRRTDLNENYTLI